MLLPGGSSPTNLISAKWLVGPPRSSHVPISAAVRGISYRGLGEDKFDLLYLFTAYISAPMAHWTCIRIAEEKG